MACNGGLSKTMSMAAVEERAQQKSRPVLAMARLLGLVSVLVILVLAPRFYYFFANKDHERTLPVMTFIGVRSPLLDLVFLMLSVTVFAWSNSKNRAVNVRANSDKQKVSKGIDRHSEAEQLSWWVREEQLLEETLRYSWEVVKTLSQSMDSLCAKRSAFIYGIGASLGLLCMAAGFVFSDYANVLFSDETRALSASALSLIAPGLPALMYWWRDQDTIDCPDCTQHQFVMNARAGPPLQGKGWGFFAGLLWVVSWQSVLFVGNLGLKQRRWIGVSLVAFIVQIALLSATQDAQMRYVGLDHATGSSPYDLDGARNCTNNNGARIFVGSVEVDGYPGTTVCAAGSASVRMAGELMRLTFVFMALAMACLVALLLHGSDVATLNPYLFFTYRPLQHLARLRRLFAHGVQRTRWTRVVETVLGGDEQAVGLPYIAAAGINVSRMVALVVLVFFLAMALDTDDIGINEPLVRLRLQLGELLVGRGWPTAVADDPTCT
tara:strand:- start:567 stop:2048 length:1482 start_codon:yes stop_codon:yes gene_type:complete